jgi:hypothetical protein
MPVASQFLDEMHHAWRQHVRASGEDVWQLGAQEAQALTHRDPALQHEGTNLVDDAGPLAHQPVTHPVQRLQVELIDRLGGDKSHRRPQHRLGDRFRVAKIILLSF